MSCKRYIIAFCFALCAVVGANAQRYLDNAIRRPDDNRNKIRLGIRGGVNVSDLTSADGLDIWNGLAFFDKNKRYIGFTDTKSKIGFNTGLTAQLKLVNRWFVQASLIYATKGYELHSQNVDIDVNAHYVQLPVEMIYKYPVKNFDLLLSGGLFLGVGINGMSHFFDHYGEGGDPRYYHSAMQEPYVNEQLGVYELIGCDATVHYATLYHSDDDDTFLSDGTYKIDGGVQLGLGFEYKWFQFMLTYQYSLTYFYNYNYDFSNRYIQKAKNDNATNPANSKYHFYYDKDGKPYSNSFEYFNKEMMTSPRQHVIGISIAFFFDKFKHNLKL